MTATLEAPQPALNTRTYDPPKVEVGQVVNWWAYGEDNGRPPVPAIVVAVGTRTVHLAVFSTMRKTVDIKDGVRHVKDPDAKRPEFVEVGAWSHTSLEARLKDIEGKLAFIAAGRGATRKSEKGEGE